MKNIFKSLAFAAMIALALSSCKDEAEIPERGNPINPEKEAAATYEGTWTFVSKVDAVETTTTYNGKLIVSEGEYPYTVKVKLDCPQLVAKAPEYAPPVAFSDGLQCAANITKLSSGVLNYYNSLPENAFSYTRELVGVIDGKITIVPVVSPFYGKITPEGKIDYYMQYSYKDEVSDFFPVEYTLTYRFNGVKLN